MDATAVRANYVYYIGAGAVTAAGLISLLRSMPTILAALVGGFKRNADDRSSGRARPRTDRDLPIKVVGIGVVLCTIAMIVLPQIGINLLAALLAVGFAFLFVTVSSRITGQIGASSNPISGMTVATVAAHRVDLSRDRVDRRRASRARAHDRRRGVRRGRRRRRDVAGPQDRIHRRGDSRSPADRSSLRRHERQRCSSAG